jgi:hypothetical protein
MGGDLGQAIPMAACRSEETSRRSFPFRKQVSEGGALRLRLSAGHLCDQPIRLVACDEGF